ncbi:MAG: SocA family protein [Campylobacteraceae bacterium]|jgi:uncharacterized phage-associated protein|nr:SocA family protein [Campylobacteraceae bacterium]
MDYLASVQALDYLANNCSNNGAINKLKALKLLFFAERYHVRKYGKFFTNDTFYAMKNGPVASGAYNIIEMKKIDKDAKEYVIANIEKIDDNTFKSLKKFGSRDDYEDLSDSAVESLDFAINTFSSIDEWRLVNKTHLYPEWKRFEEFFQNETNKNKRRDINTDDFFAPCKVKNDPFSIISQKTVEANKDWFKGDF